MLDRRFNRVTAGEGDLRYPGQYFDKESGLHYNGFRTYDLQTGRYTQGVEAGSILPAVKATYPVKTAIGASWTMHIEYKSNLIMQPHPVRMKHEKKPFFSTCPYCGMGRCIFFVKSFYRCNSCAASLKIRKDGVNFIEMVIAAPISALFCWMISEAIASRGFSRDLSHQWGIFASAVAYLSIAGLIRP